MKLLAAIALCLTPVPLTPAASENDFFLRDGETVVFIGDSNTYGDRYVQYLDAYLFTRFPGRRFTLINRGMPSETVAGTSEISHIPPRPDLHTRFSGTVPPLAPDVVVACYGMNDGIYQPPNEEVFAKYRAGIGRLVRRTKEETKARLVLLTPPPFDPAPFKSKPASDAPDYRLPALNYDDALAQFSNWLLSLRASGQRVVDLHTPMNEHVRARRMSDPGWKLAGDGIHFNALGHGLVAAEILAAWNAPAIVSEAVLDARRKKAVSREVADVKFESDGAVRFAWRTPSPWPMDPQWDAASVALAKFNERFNRHRLAVKSLSKPRYDVLADGAKFATASAAELAEGLDLTRCPEFPSVKRAQEVLRLVQKRRQMLLELWVRDDPHPRLAGMHKQSKVTAAEAAELEARIRTLCQPMTVKVALLPAP